MKVEIFTLPDAELIDYSNRDVVEVRVDGRTVWSVYDSDPKDATLRGSFADCYRVDVLMKLAYEAGVNKQRIEFIKKKVSGDILWQ
jgi:hypothetical protein